MKTPCTSRREKLFDLFREIAKEEIAHAISKETNPILKMVVFWGGVPPKQTEEGSGRFDVFIRAIIGHRVRNQETGLGPYAVFAFDYLENGLSMPKVRRGVDGVYVYDLDPGEMVSLAAGFSVELPPGGFVEVHGSEERAARESLVFSDNKGELCLDIYNRGKKRISLEHGLKIASIAFGKFLLPTFDEVKSVRDFDRVLILPAPPKVSLPPS
ncbi:MAG: hypothetical protein AAB495_00775 [Patescibacteria group bacterium]